MIPIRIINLLAISAVIFSTALAVTFARQLPLDLHSFRQTQTALTAYWFIQEGYKLAYETPVGGYPWAIPFEFPIYQYIVATLSKILHLPVDASGRVISFCFLLLCIPVVWSINRRLSLPPIVVAIFVAILFTTPLYVYWGRAVLIETAALFFVLLAIKYFLDYLLGTQALLKLVLFSCFMTIGLLQKATTGLPVLVVLTTVLLVGTMKKTKIIGRFELTRIATLAGSVIFPIIVATAWTHYTDQLKSENPLGQYLTSKALTEWNWGTLSQRISPELWQVVLLMRILIMNLGWLLGFAIIAAAIGSKASHRVKSIILISFALGILPLFMFTNLHIVHEYYQMSCVIFLIYALSVCLGAVVFPFAGTWAALLLLVGLLLGNTLALLRTGYLNQMMITFGRENRDVVIGEILKREVSAGGQFVAFGNDYSSTFSYLSERKSFSVPKWFSEMPDVIARPEQYVEKGRLGAVVACSNVPSHIQVLDWASSHGNWKVGEATGCTIAVPSNHIDTTLEPAECRGNIDHTDIKRVDGRSIVTIGGWVTTGTPPIGPDGVFVSITPEGKPSIYLDTLRIPRLDVNEVFKINESDDLGFSRSFVTDLPPGQYTVKVVQRLHNRYSACPIQKVVQLN